MNFTGRQSGERNQQKSVRHRKGLRERQKPKRKETIGKGSSEWEEKRREKREDKRE